MEGREFFRAVRHNTRIVSRLFHILSYEENEILNHIMRTGKIILMMTEKLSQMYPDYRIGSKDKEFAKDIEKLLEYYDNPENQPEESIRLEKERAIKLYSLSAAMLIKVLLGCVSEKANDYYSSEGVIEFSKNLFDNVSISKETELISMAQCYDAITGYIPYFPKRTAEQGYRAIKEGGCGKFSEEAKAALNIIKDDLPEENRFTKKVLIVDDQKISRVILSEMFKADFGIIEASTAELGTELLNKHRNEIILVIVDYRLSGTSGIDFLYEFRRNSDNDGVPIAVGTLATNDDDVSLCYEYGADDIIYKPFERKEVRRRMLNLVELYEYKARR